MPSQRCCKLEEVGYVCTSDAEPEMQCPIIRCRGANVYEGMSGFGEVVEKASYKSLHDFGLAMAVGLPLLLVTALVAVAVWRLRKKSANGNGGQQASSW